MVLSFAWDSCRCVWTCFLWLVCTNSTHAYVLDQLRRATTKSSMLRLSREGDSCSAVNCHVLCTFVCNFTACHGAWQHQHPARHFLCSFPSCHHLSPSSQKKKKKKVCFIIMALLCFWHKLSIKFDILVDIKAYR